jgi:aspartate/methionine/tyrosine aminotransferase
MFSSRLPSELAPNALSRAVERWRRSGRVILDLTETNPTRVDVPYPPDLLHGLSDARSGTYRPDPLGASDVRQAVAEEYVARGASIDADHVVLTASTSEAYAYLFKLLTDPGDSVLVPQPSYPLFELLTRLEGVRADPYRLARLDDWSIDRDSLQRSLAASTRAILVVNPNNPTGSMLRVSDRDWLVTTAREHGHALVSDEVFGEYPIAPRPEATSLAGENRALTFTLGGLSKSAGLPQVKLAWIVVSGPDRLAAQALERLEVIADSYLSVSTPVQIAARRLIEGGREVRAAIAHRIRRNFDRLRSLADVHPALTVFAPEGGWSVVVRIPTTDGEEAFVLRLLDEAGVLVHPGYFFDFEEEAFLVLSLLPSPDVFDEAIRRIGLMVQKASVG